MPGSDGTSTEVKKSAAELKPAGHSIEKQIEILKASFNITYATLPETLTLPESVKETQDILLLRLCQEFMLVRAEVEALKINVDKKLQNQITKDYREILKRNLDTAIAEITPKAHKLITIALTYQARCDLIYSPSENMPPEQKAFTAFSQACTTFLNALEQTVLNLDDTEDRDFLKPAIEKFASTFLAQLTETASKSESEAITQHKYRLFSILQAKDFNMPLVDKIKEGAKQLLAECSDTFQNAVDSWRLSKEDRANQALKKQITSLYNAALAIEEFPMHAIYEYTGLKQTEDALYGTYLAMRKALTEQAESLVIPLIRLEQLLATRSEQHQTVLAAKEQLLTAMKAADYALNKECIPTKDHTLQTWVPASIVNQQQRQQANEASEKRATEDLYQQIQTSTQVLAANNTFYEQQKLQYACAYKATEKYAQKTNALVEVKAIAASCEQLSAKYTELYGRTGIPETPRDMDSLTAMDNENRSAQITAATNFSIAKPALARVCNDKFEACRAKLATTQLSTTFTHTNPIELFKPANPFEERFNNEATQIKANIESLEKTVTVDFENNTNELDDLISWRGRFNQIHQEISGLFITLERTKNEADEFERRLATTTYQISLKAMQDIRTEYGRIFDKYQHTNPEASAKLPGKFNEHFTSRLDPDQLAAMGSIKTRLPKLFFLHKTLEGINQQFLSMTFQVNDTYYHSLLLNFIAEELQDEDLELLSAEERPLYQKIRMKFLKPLNEFILGLCNKAYALWHPNTPRLFKIVTPAACDTEKKLRETRDTTQAELSAQTPARR